MSARWVTARTQWRQLRLGPVILDTIMMTAVGMLSMFVLLLASFQNVDAVLFEAGLRYETRDTIDPPGSDGLVVSAWDGVSVFSAERFDAPDRMPADFNGGAHPRVWSVGSTSLSEVAAVLGANALSGEVSDGAILLDETSAVALDVSPGDELVVHVIDVGDCRLTLGGIVRSYREVGGSFVGGLLVASSAACPGILTPPEGADTVQFDSADPSPLAQTWPERMLQIVLAATDFRVAGLLPAILFVGLGLWVLMGWRATRRVRETLQFSSELLFDLGVRPRRVRTAFLLAVSVMAMVAAVTAAWGAHEALWRVASFHTQWLHWLCTGALFGAATILVALLVDRRDRRRFTTRPDASPAASRQGDS
jgi:hypothetical protein